MAPSSSGPRTTTISGRKHCKQLVISLALAACLLLGSYHAPSSWSDHRRARPGRKILHVEPVWETVSNRATSRSHPIYYLLGVKDDKRTIILRIYYEDSRRNLQQQEIRIEDGAEEEEQLAVNVAFEDIYKTILFIAATWLLGHVSVRIGMPSLVGEIVTGFLLGPPLADFCPFPEAMVLIGNFGLIGLILESGIDIDVAQLKETGVRAVLMAFTGTTLPLLAGLGLGIAAREDLKSAIAVGAVFAPSSLGVSANVLQAGDVLNTPVGQMIVASSVVDDVLGLILLSILGVFVKADAMPFDYILPFLASFGYLAVLGYSGITWMPYWIEHKIMPYFSEQYRELAAYSMMFFLLLAYLPLLNYSGASYLTGAFLAGLPFSQIHIIHASFAQNGRQLLNWLLRIFFAATIGFQVPVRKFSDPYVLRWGVKFIVPVLAKLPIGFFVSRTRTRTKLPDDFPYDPYWRDVFTTAFAVLCRGEFNFIIAAFALSNGLIGPELYSAVVFAVLLSAVLGPLMLARVISYYNNKSKDYIDGGHPIQRIGDSCDGYRPLFLAIQARTPVEWGLQENFKKTLEEIGLIIIDHRSWHTLGNDTVDLAHCWQHDAVDVTELFVQDTKMRVKVESCFSPNTSLRSGVPTMIGKKKDGDDTGDTMDDESASVKRLEKGLDEDQQIQKRCFEIEELLSQSLISNNPGDYVIQVSQWEAYVFDGDEKGVQRERFFTFHSQTLDAADNAHASASSSTIDRGLDLGLDLDLQAAGCDRLESMYQDGEPHLAQDDLWEADPVVHEAMRECFVMTPDVGGYGGYDVIAPLGEQIGGCRRRAKSFDVRLLAVTAAQAEVETATVKERLHGYVRQGKNPSAVKTEESRTSIEN